MEKYIIHYGTANSGRYPRGSGENPNQHSGTKNPYNLTKRQRSTIDKNLSNYRNKDITSDNVDSVIRDLNRKRSIKNTVNDIRQKDTFSHSRKIGGKVIDALLIATATVAVKDILSSNSTIRKGLSGKNIEKIVNQVGTAFRIKAK